MNLEGEMSEFGKAAAILPHTTEKIRLKGELLPWEPAAGLCLFKEGGSHWLPSPLAGFLL